MTERGDREIEHGKFLAASEHTEGVWGWGTPAGQQRAIRRAELIAKGAVLKDGAVALERGCGTGLFTEYMAKTGARLVAVDISPELLAKARERGLPEGQVTFVEKRFEECHEEGPFDAVVGSSVLHHLDIEASLKTMFSLLKPGGKVSFAEPNMLNPQIFIERHFRQFFPQVSPDETAFVRWRFAAQLRSAGFVNVAITPFDWLHPATPSALIPVVNGCGRCIEHIPLLREISGSLHICAEKPA